jgi:hypothetical protein
MKNARTVVDDANLPTSGAMRVFVSGLSEQLADIEEKDLKEVRDFLEIYLTTSLNRSSPVAEI